MTSWKERRAQIVERGVRIETHESPKRIPCEHCGGKGHIYSYDEWATIEIGTQSFRLGRVPDDHYGKGKTCHLCGSTKIHMRWYNAFNDVDGYICCTCLNLLRGLEHEGEVGSCPHCDADRRDKG